MQVKVSDLSGFALDWAVAKCEGCGVSVREFKASQLSSRKFDYSSAWALGGPIKTRELIATKPRFLAAGYEYPEGKWVWQAHLLGPNNIDDNHEQEHESELVATMRCYVSIKMGDVIEVPDELI